jgi:hypothetical protein
MDDVLDIQLEEEGENNTGRAIRVGIPIRLGDHETFFPISQPLASLNEWDTMIQNIMAGIERLSQRGKELLEPPKEEQVLDLSGDPNPEELWSRLSKIEAEDHFVRAFNQLAILQRRELADYVLTTCNVFAGKAAIFSSRYHDDSGSLV